MNISIVIPAYNEEKRIEPSLKQITLFLSNHFEKYEIIIVNDSSNDNTDKVISKYLNHNIKILKNEKKMGKGYSVKRGILNAKYPLVLFSDSDLSTPIEELENFIEDIHNGYDIVIASRCLKESKLKNKQPQYRQILGKIFPILANLIVSTGIKDTQCGFKLFKLDVAKNIFKLQTFDRFAFDVEILFIAKKLGYKIKEAPVVWIDKEGTKVSPLKDGFLMLVDLFKIRINDLLGKYNVSRSPRFLERKDLHDQY